MAGSSNATEMKLTTVQLFDLVEAIDQFLADSQTLPEMNLSVESLPRRYAKAATPVVQRALPAAIGASTLTVAAAALFMVPVPKFTPPERPAAETSQDVQGEEPAPGSTPVETAEPAASEQPADVVAAAAALDDRVETSPSITDAEQVADLQQQLETKIREQLSDRLEFTEDLVYRVAVSEQGDLIGYKYVNDAALLNVDETPLPGLTFIPLNQELVRQEPVAQFRVTFTPLGELAVEPWSDSDRAAQPPDSPEADTPEADAPEITAELPATIENEIVTPVLIEDLNQRLYRALRDRQLPELSSDLTYRVRLDEAGDVVGYEALDAASQAVLDETPLPGLATADGDTSAPQADFRIAFTQNGVLEVSPWKGWPR
ncbi:MAG: DUF4335 domain-containing protein [Leptolyngbyaceae cyanobacterium SM1_1_3]|nr:DUF4335 domain-containing protein [Leptolyngbyaceae cyanobacterium SM1_1_3]